jgi:TolA-binding protein
MTFNTTPEQPAGPPSPPPAGPPSPPPAGPPAGPPPSNEIDEELSKIKEEVYKQLQAYNKKIDELSKKLEELITAELETTDVEIKEQIKNSEETLKTELRQLQNDKDLLLAEIKSSNNLSDGEVRNIDINIENITRGGGGGGGGYMPQQPLVITQPSAPVIQQPIVAPQPVRVYDREKKDDSGVSMANVMLYALPSIAIVGIIYIMMNRMNKKK